MPYTLYSFSTGCLPENEKNWLLRNIRKFRAFIDASQGDASQGLRNVFKIPQENSLKRLSVKYRGF